MRSAPTRTWIGELELGLSAEPRGVSRPPHPVDSSARLLVRLHRQVLGFVSIPLRGEPPGDDAVWSAVRAQLGNPMRRHLQEDGLPVPEESQTGGVGGSDVCVHGLAEGPSRLVSVVVCTRDRPVILASCLELLQQLHYDNFEVIVVDNAPSSEQTRSCFIDLVGDDQRFRYVQEPLPGLSRARNRGLAEAKAQYVAFTDDDVMVDPWWLEGIVAGFARDPLTGCVTGLVPPAELDDPAQQFFDRRYSWSSHLETRVFDLNGRGDESPLYPFSAGLFGTGANFAVDRELLEDLGGFDEALGAGSPAGGGEDLDAFVRVLRAGRSLVYEPSAIVWHVHRASARALRRQLFYYGVGLTAFLTKYLLDLRTAGEIVARLPAGLRRGRRIWSPAEIGGPAPKALVLAEVAGMLAGPFAYLRGRHPR
ncbi:MAG: glycosyltransferase family 2 protein [Acidimicrobiales bacterium]